MNNLTATHRISTKLFLILLVGYLFLTVLLASVYVVNKYGDIKNTAFENQEMLLSAISLSLGEVTYDGDLDQLESLLKGVLESPSIAGIAYSDNTNILSIELGDIPDYHLLPNIKHDINQVSKFQVGALFGLFGSIAHNEKKIGDVIISSGRSVILNELQSSLILITLIMFSHAILSWFIFKWVARVYLDRRLSDITKGLNDFDIVTGNFVPLKVDEDENDEIWLIQRTFNHVAEKLQATLSELRHQNEILEEKVRERTAELEKISVTDRLTNLYNRHKLDEALDLEFDRSIRYGSEFGLIILDIDNFKSVNDTYGHACGDKVLVQIARILENSTREIDVVGRWGGEEFLIIVPQNTIDGILSLANKIRIAVAEYSFSEVGHKTISLGAAVYKKGDSISDLISRADSALYASKEAGRNQVRFI